MALIDAILKFDSEPPASGDSSLLIDYAQPYVAVINRELILLGTLSPSPDLEQQPREPSCGSRERRPTRESAYDI